MALWAAPASAQSVPVFQSGLVQPNDIAKYERSGSIRNAGTIAGDNNGIGVNPFAVTDFGQPGIATNSGPTSAPYQQLDLGHTATHHRIEALGLAGAPALPLEICANGTCLDFPFLASGVAGPGSSTVNNLVAFGNSTGNLLKDSGIPSSRVGQSACGVLETFGGAGDGVTDNVAAWTSLVATNPTCVRFLAGTYRFNTQISYTLTTARSLTVKGEGREATRLLWPNSAGGMLLISSALSQPPDVSDLAFLTGQPNGGNALELTTNLASIPVPNWNQGTVRNVVFRGSDGLAVANFWTRGLYILNAGQISCDTCSFWGAQTGSVGGYAGNGIGIDLQGDASHLITVFNISNYVGMYLASCWNYGNNAQGVTIQYSNCTGGTNGLTMSGGSGQFQLNMTDNQINVSATAIGLTTLLNSSDIHDNLILLPTAASVGVLFDPIIYAQVHHNAIQGLGATHGIGVRINSQFSPSYSHIDNNLFTAVTTGVQIANGVNLVALDGNKYFANTTPINNLNPAYWRALIVDSPLDCTATFQVLFGSTPQSLATPYCKYQNNGNNLTVSMLAAFNGAVPAGTATVAGLPIQGGLSGAGAACAMTNISNVAGFTSPNPYIVPGTTTVVLAQNAATGSSNMTNANFTSTSSFVLYCSIPLLP